MRAIDDIWSAEASAMMLPMEATITTEQRLLEMDYSGKLGPRQLIGGSKTWLISRAIV